MNLFKMYDIEEVNTIKQIAADSATSCFGVVAMSPKNTADGIKMLFKKDNPSRGVWLETDEAGRLTISLYIVVEYGIRVNAVAENLIETVKYRIEKEVGCKVKKVEINVVALRA